MAAVMTPEHPHWQEFAERLEGEEGCNFRKDGDGKITWSCKGGRDKTFAATILRMMPDIDVDASLAFFEAHGGHCDCEILFNVKPLLVVVDGAKGKSID